MLTTKLRAPDSFSALSLEGRGIEVANDGSYHADARDVATLRAHGFTDWHDHPGAGGNIETMTHAQLADAAAKRTRDEAMMMDPERLRSALRERPPAEDAEPSQAELAAADARLKSEQEVTEARIETMNRAELFAYLRGHAVAIGPATKDPGLRAAALDHFRRSRAAA